MRPRGAFTILEAVAAVVIIGVAIPPMLWGVKQAHAHRSAKVLASRARWLAAEKLEDIIADRHSTTLGYTYLTAANYPDEPEVPGFENFARAVTFQETAADLASAGAGYMTVTCTVAFRDASGQTRSLALATVVTDYTP